MVAWLYTCGLGEGSYDHSVLDTEPAGVRTDRWQLMLLCENKGELKGGCDLTGIVFVLEHKTTLVQINVS